MGGWGVVSNVLVINLIPLHVVTLAILFKCRIVKAILSNI
jgi:hypothetical protein